MIISKYIIDFIIHNQSDYISSIESISYIILNILLGVTTIKGLFYLNELQNKTKGATFNYWSQLKVRIAMIKSEIELDKKILYNLCSKDIRAKIGFTGEVNPDLAKNLLNLVKELYCFIEESSDQMPVYIGWTNDFDTLCVFLRDLIHFDITKNDEGFKFDDVDKSDAIDDYIDQNLTNMDKLINGIESKQKELEIKINTPLSSKISKKVKNIKTELSNVLLNSRNKNK